jgi:hypothetical protein
MTRSPAVFASSSLAGYNAIRHNGGVAALHHSPDMPSAPVQPWDALLYDKNDNNLLLAARIATRVHRGGASTTLASSTLQQWIHSWFRIPSPIRFVLSGSVGTLCLFVLEFILAQYLVTYERLPVLLHPQRDVLTFFLGYVLHIVVQHYSHAVLVYGLDTINTRQKYFATLLQMYATLMTSGVLSTLCNALLLQYTPLNNKQVVMTTTIVIFAVINFLVIDYLMARNNSSGTIAPPL